MSYLEALVPRQTQLYLPDTVSVSLPPAGLILSPMQVPSALGLLYRAQAWITLGQGWTSGWLRPH